MTNWPEKIATDLATSFDDVPIYSNVDPNREYNGGETIELNVQEQTATATITGAIVYDFRLVAACRAPSYSDGLELVGELREALDPLLAGYVSTNDASAFFVGSQEITADARGLIEGESFYGLLNFTIQETERA